MNGDKKGPAPPLLSHVSVYFYLCPVFLFSIPNPSLLSAVAFVSFLFSSWKHSFISSTWPFLFLFLSQLFFVFPYVRSTSTVAFLFRTDEELFFPLSVTCNSIPFCVRFLSFRSPSSSISVFSISCRIPFLSLLLAEKILFSANMGFLLFQFAQHSIPVFSSSWG